MNNWCICWFLHSFLLGILIFKGLTARRLYKSFGIKGLINKEFLRPASPLSLPLTLSLGEPDPFCNAKAVMSPLKLFSE
jgi:hypothetical protein